MAKKRATQTVELVAALQRAGQPELEALQQEIADVDTRIGELKKERASYISAKRLIDLKLNGKMAPSGRASPADRNERREKIYDFLTNEGPSSAKAIAQATEIPVSGVHKLLKHEWFDHTPEGWTVARSGRD